MREAELVVIGGGASGRAVATQAAGRGIATTLVDERPLPPAWRRWQVPYWYGSRPTTAHGAMAIEELDTVRVAGVEVLSHTSCWGAFEDNVLGLYDHRAGVGGYLQAQRLVLATGTSDLALPFPGWTLPGVLGARAALDLLGRGVALPGGRVAVLGSGMLARDCATVALAAGYDVIALIDVQPELPADRDGVTRLAAQGVELLLAHLMREAGGSGTLEHVVVAPVAGGAARALSVDTLIVAVGEVPNIELAYLLGCELAFDERHGGHHPLHTAQGATSVPNVFVLGGAAGEFDTSQYDQQAAQVVDALVGGTTSPLPAGNPATAAVPVNGAHLTEWHRVIVGNLSDTDIVCMCEQTSLAAVLRGGAISGEASPDETKRLSRVGAGVCQGRCCRHTLTGIVAAQAGVAYATLPPPSLRPPLRPVPLQALAHGDAGDLPLLTPFADLLDTLQAERDSGTLPAAVWPAVLFRVREENAYALREGYAQREVERAAETLAGGLRALPPH